MFELDKIRSEYNEILSEHKVLKPKFSTSVSTETSLKLNDLVDGEHSAVK